MNRQKLRSAKQKLKRENAKATNVLTEVLPPPWTGQSKSPVNVFRSKTFLVQVFEEENATRLSICRTSIDNDGQWIADIKWEELQEIKRQVGYGDHLAVEIYPKDKDIVNVANMRHLWIPNWGIDFGWKK